MGNAPPTDLRNIPRPNSESAVEIKYTHTLPHPRQRVWEALLDPNVLSRVLPGVEKFEAVGDYKFSVSVKLGVASIKGSYVGMVQITDQQFPSSYRLRGEGKGGPGWAKGEALMTLSEQGSSTDVTAHGKVQVGGTIAGVGQRLMEGVAKEMAREFFTSIDREMRGQQQKVSTFGFSLRVLFGIIRGFFGRLLGRRVVDGDFRS